MDYKAFTKRLEEAVKSYNQRAAVQLCQDLILVLSGKGEPCPAADCRNILQLLRSKCFFLLMESVGACFLRTGKYDATVRRRYTQALIDLGRLDEALTELNQILRDPQTSETERGEAWGLTGRVYKQKFINEGGRTGPNAKEHLDAGLGAYWKAFKTDKDRFLWQGINAVGLMERAARDGLDVRGEEDAKAVAAFILDEVRTGTISGTATMWDYATAAEACLALGKKPEALGWCQKYVNQEGTDAFELSSTFRQFTQLWGLDPSDTTEAAILTLLRSELLLREGGRVELDPVAVQREKVFGVDDFVTVRWYRLGLERCQAVGRISRLSDGTGGGTGFLVRGSDLKTAWGEGLVLVTNYHVMNESGARDALRRDEALIQFEEHRARAEYRAAEILWVSEEEKLDTTIFRLDTDLPPDVEPCPLARALPLTNNRQRVYIIGHPLGDLLRFSLQDNVLIASNERYLQYRAPTEPGSSGSPVFSQADWSIVALHHRGLEFMSKLDGTGQSAANQGVRFDAVRKAIQEA